MRKGDIEYYARLRANERRKKGWSDGNVGLDSLEKYLAEKGIRIPKGEEITAEERAYYSKKLCEYLAESPKR